MMTLDIEQRAVNTGRQADLNYFLDFLAVKPERADFQLAIVGFAHKADDDEHRGNELRNYRGERDTGDVHIAHYDEKQVK